MVKKSAVPVIALLILVVLTGGGYLALHNRGNAQSTMDMSTSDNTSSGTPTRPEATNIVTIQNFAFTPASITVKKGTQVTWANHDSAAHTVTENDGQTGPDSGTMNPGSGYSFTFTTAGTYHYHCAFHPSMLGTVVVTN